MQNNIMGVSSGISDLRQLPAGVGVFRTDRKTFHLSASDHPVSYPQGDFHTKSKITSIGFWYRHTQRPPITESLVVVLKHPPSHPFHVRHKIELVADRLAAQLVRKRELKPLYEFDCARSTLKAL